MESPFPTECGPLVALVWHCMMFDFSGLLSSLCREPLPSPTMLAVPQGIMQALTFPTNSFLHGSQDICWPWRVLKQCEFPGPLCGFSSWRKIYARISALFSSCFVPALACAHCLQGNRVPIMVETQSIIIIIIKDYLEENM